MKVVILLNNKYWKMVKTLLEYSRVPMQGTIYYFDQEPEKVPSFNSYPIDKIVEHQNEECEMAILATEITEQSVRVVFAAYPKIGGVYDLAQAAAEFLTDDGRLPYLKVRTEFINPRPDLPYVQIGDFTYFDHLNVMSEVVDGSVVCKIGKFCSLGPDTTVLLAEEHRTTWGTTFPFDEITPGYGLPERSTFSKGDVIIGNDVWTGKNVTILSGVTIGDGCVIGAGTVLSKSVPPYTIVAGNPAVNISTRIPDDWISRFLEMKWWDWDYENLYKALPLLQSQQYEQLYEYYKKHIFD